MQAPLLDKRTRDEVLEQALRLAGIDIPAAWLGYVPDWKAATDDRPDDPGRRMLDLFSRLAELLIERVNRVPEKNFLAFLDLAGVERFAGAPAEVPVTFLVSKRAVLGGVVPAGTQVATTQTKTANARVYETRRSFFATKAKLDRVVALHPDSDHFVELSAPLLPPTAPSLEGAEAVSVLGDDTSHMQDVAHVLYLASEALFARKDVVDVSVTIQFAGGSFPIGIAWRRYDKKAKTWVSLPTSSVSLGASQITFVFPALAGVAKVAVYDVEDFWIAGSFDGSFPVAGLPAITAITGAVAATPVTAAVVDGVFFNAAELDVSKPFLPFGGRPAYADAFYIGSETGFAPDNASATVTLDIRPYTNADLSTQFAGITSPLTINTKATWQYLDVNGNWVDFQALPFDHTLTLTPSAGTTTVTTRTGGSNGESTLMGSASGDASVQIAVPALTRIGVHKLHKVESRWIRMLLVSDKPYGIDGVITGSAATTKFVGPLLIPPRVEKLTIAYTPGATAVAITRVRTFNNFAWQSPTVTAPGFAPFLSVSSYAPDGAAVDGSSPALYLAFDQPFEPAAFISCFVDLAGPASSLTSPLEAGNPNVAWEYWSDLGWRSLDVTDDTLDLTTSGTVAFVAPSDSAPVTLFEYTNPDAKPDATPRWWLRARLASGHFDYPPRIRGVYANSVMAANQTTVAELLVGSSNGEPNQEFVLVKAPVLAGSLWVREPNLPTAQERDDLEAELLGDGVEPRGPGQSVALELRAIEGGEPEVWVRWRRVQNFELSGPRYRHYLIDAVAGRVIFGGGDAALIPPALRDNLVLRGFESGGGGGANAETPPLAVKELKTSLSFIDRVFNVNSAAGGASEWSMQQLMEFGPEDLKTRGRSVTTEDYQRMILQRFSEVARVRCVAVHAPGPGGSLAFKPGSVTALVVPWSAEPRPQPSQGLIRKVKEFLAGTVLANIVGDVYVKGPDYVALNIAADLVPTHPELASVILRKAQAALEEFLHPLTGGEHGEGYDFGRDVYLSEVHAVLGRIDGVDYVRSARFIDRPGSDVFEVVGDRLPSSGAHQLAVVPGEG